MDDTIKTHIDVDKLRSRSTSIPYPHIRIDELSNCIPLVVSILNDGDIPLLATLKGTTKIIKRISKSALTISKLLRVSSVTVYLSVKENYRVTDIVEYMEVLARWI